MKLDALQSHAVGSVIRDHRFRHGGIIDAFDICWHLNLPYHILENLAWKRLLRVPQPVSTALSNKGKLAPVGLK